MDNSDQDAGIVTSSQPLQNERRHGAFSRIDLAICQGFFVRNPNAPAIFQQQAAPQIDVQFNIGAAQIADDVHEITLKIEVRAEVESQVAFIVDLSYAGLFGLRNIPAEHLQPFLLGEAPRLIFPFARRVLADAVRDGGFPPLMLEPIDFVALYMQQAEAQAQTAVDDGVVGRA